MDDKENGAIRTKRNKTFRLKLAREKLRANYERRRMRKAAETIWVDVPALTEAESIWINSLE